MKLGVIFSQAFSGTDPEAIRRWAITAEEAGFEMLMAYDHVLGASRERLGPGPFGTFDFPPYTNEDTFQELLVLVSHLSAVTTTIEFVTSVIVLPQRQAPLVAKQLATLDLLSGGRLQVGVGVGWNFAEYAGMGVDFRQRTAIIEEQMTVMRKLWTEPLVTFQGRFHTLDRVGITPLPSRPIPLWMGSGGSDPALRRVARFADGWYPLILPHQDPWTVADSVTRLRRYLEEEGRDPAAFPIHGRAYLLPDWQRLAEEAAELGFSHFSIGFPYFMIKDRTHPEQLQAAIDAKPELEAIVGR